MIQMNIIQVDGTVVYFSPCEGNQNKVRQFEETLRFEEVIFYIALVLLNFFT